jgi:hypothetical protein
MLKSITNFRLPRVSPPTNWIDESSDEDSNPLVTEEPVDPFFERLLPSSIEPPLFYVLPENRTPKDKLMVFLYLSALAVLLFASLFTFGTQNPGHVAKAIYDSIIDRAGRTFNSRFNINFSRSFYRHICHLALYVGQFRSSIMS